MAWYSSVVAARLRNNATDSDGQRGQTNAIFTRDVRIQTQATTIYPRCQKMSVSRMHGIFMWLPGWHRIFSCPIFGRAAAVVVAAAAMVSVVAQKDGVASRKITMPKN